VTDTSVELFYSVFMDQRPMDAWVTSCEIKQPKRVIYKQFSITLAGFNDILVDSPWDIYATYDYSVPQSEIEIRAGYLTKDRARSVVIQTGQVPIISLTGYDLTYQMQRRGPLETIVFVPNGQTAEKVVRNSTLPIGRYRVWEADSLRDAVTILCHQAGFNLEYRLPNWDMAPYIVPPTQSYWEAIIQLISPWKPKIYYDRQNNTVVFYDPLADRYNLGQIMHIGDNIRRIESQPIIRNRIRRTIGRYPRVA
jgi:hypothetical protein